MLSEKVPLIRGTARASATKNGSAYAGMQEPIPRPGTMERTLHPLAREFAHILQGYRRRKRLTIEQLAARSGIAAAAIKRFESASHAPDISELLRLAPVYGMPAWRIVKRLQAISERLDEIDNEP